MPMADKHLPVIPETQTEAKIQLLTPKEEAQSPADLPGKPSVSAEAGRNSARAALGSGASILYTECQMQALTLKSPTERLLCISQHL